MVTVGRTLDTNCDPAPDHAGRIPALLARPRARAGSRGRATGAVTRRAGHVLDTPRGRSNRFRTASCNEEPGVYPPFTAVPRRINPRVRALR
jgi:hypothetical protein